jgi:predicted DNA-binding protein (MmcQ/YjbR family)
MTRQELIDFCLAFPAVYEDYPFDDVTDPGAWTVMRHLTNRKSFALVYRRNGKLCVNLKCDPLEADLLRRVFVDVTPAYHMNKVHWNTVALGGDVSDDDLKLMVERSYDLIKPRLRERR